MSENFPAMVIREVDGKPSAAMSQLSLADLPNHEILVRISASSVNYKDGLAISGKSPIARRLPMVAGIDLAGTVVSSQVSDWKEGDRIIVNGWGMSETEWGGYSHFQRVKPGWLTRLPAGFTPHEAMAIGTAGYTAALCVNALEDWGRIGSHDREVLVTGAAGGVGSVAVSLLAAKGYRVAASTGRTSAHDYLRELGATTVVDRSELGGAVRPLQKERWSGVVDTVGSTTLANALAQTAYGGAVAACGLAGGSDLPGSVFPHILRNVALIGVDSVYAPHALRDQAWATLEKHLNREQLTKITSVYAMDQLPVLADRILSGDIRGRAVVNIAGD